MSIVQKLDSLLARWRLQAEAFLENQTQFLFFKKNEGVPLEIGFEQLIKKCFSQVVESSFLAPYHTYQLSVKMGFRP